MTDLYIVTCLKVDHDLLHQPVDGSFPLAFPDREEIKQAVARLDYGADDREFRSQVWQLGRLLKQRSEQRLYERRETFGTFMSFADAERYVVRHAADWDECGYYNVARIARVEDGLTCYQLVRADDCWWYEIQNDEPRGPGNDLVAVPIPHPLRFQGHLWHDRRRNDEAR